MIQSYSDFVKAAKTKALICPSILTADFAHLGDSIAKIEAEADWIHIDVMDGVFVPNISFGLPVVRAIKKITNKPLDVHLMIVKPEKYIEDFIKAGADMLVIHSEACQHLHSAITTIKSHNIKAGVAINPSTPISTIEEILPYIDMVLVMSVNPGFGGQSYIRSMTSKITRLRKHMENNGIEAHIQVDGGIGIANIKTIVDAGASAIVAGSAVFSAKDPANAIRELRKCLE